MCEGWEMGGEMGFAAATREGEGIAVGELSLTGNGEGGRAQGGWQMDRYCGISGGQWKEGVRSDDELDVSALIQTVGTNWSCTVPIPPERFSRYLHHSTSMRTTPYLPIHPIPPSTPKPSPHSHPYPSSYPIQSIPTRQTKTSNTLLYPSPTPRPVPRYCHTVYKTTHSPHAPHASLSNNPVARAYERTAQSRTR